MVTAVNTDISKKWTNAIYLESKAEPGDTLQELFGNAILRECLICIIPRSK